MSQPNTALLALAGLLFGCTIDIPMERVSAAPRAPRTLVGSGALDILVVLDNSTSMEEEHVELAASLFRAGCPIQSLTAVPTALQDPEGPLLDEIEDLCGFAQILAAYDRDFRVGVITTDVNACDNTFEVITDGDVHRPQRGCLQPVPDTGQRVLSRGDLDIGEKFLAMVGDVGTLGSSYERGLDAADFFFAGKTFMPECEGDLDLLRRPDADLLMVFITDEDDCSHGDGVGGFDDETVETCGFDTSHFTDHSPDACRTLTGSLPSVASYAERLRGVAGAGRLSVLVLGGALPVRAEGETTSYRAAGCRWVASDEIIDGACYESGGLSSFNGTAQICGPAAAEERGGLPCCDADAATRYQELALLVDGSVYGICANDYVNAISRALE